MSGVLRFVVWERGVRSSWSFSGCCLGDHDAQSAQVEWSFDSKGPTERLAASRELQAPGRGVQVRPSPRKRSVPIRCHDRGRGLLNCDDSHQSGLVRTLSAADARTKDLRQSTRFARRLRHRFP